MKAAALPPPPRRGSSQALLLLAVLALAGTATLLHALLARAEGMVRRQAARELVQTLQLTDLAWFTEARYTRHPGLADLHSAFQDAPGGAEHFPSGAWVAPPRHFPAAGLQLMPPEPVATPRTDE